MSDFNEVIQKIENSPAGPHIGAIFDFDGTLISGFSATIFLKEQIKRGDLTLQHLVEMLTVTGQMLVGKVGFSGMMASSAKLLAGVTEQSYEELGEDLFKQQIKAKIYPEARAILEAHRAKGHTLAIISSATPYQVEPAARDLGIEHVLCTRYEVENGEFNGEIVRPVCFGEGKVHAAEQLSAAQGVDLDDSFFYTDSYDDIELLERVGRPQAMNPNKKLTKAAKQKKWPIHRLTHIPKPTAFQRARSIAATGSLITSFINGLPILGLTGSKREAVNFSISQFGDLAAAIIGMKLVVKNEKYIWTDRPCVFIFNHQSGADMMIIAKLLRKDVASVGKKEIGDIPLLGRVFKYAGAVLIDRENAASAIEAMAPLVDVVRDEGRSICIAPEGTRSNSRNIGQFKKGAFHLAMQAGVPIVPIVIHNAHEVLPENGKVFRPGTVNVEILKPVKTDDWQLETLDQHIADVQQMYITTLSKSGPIEVVAADSSKKRLAKPKAAGEKKRASAAKAKKATAKKAPAKKVAAKKVGAKKVAAKKVAAKKASAKQASGKKVSASKAAPKKATTKKASAKKVATKKATSKKATSKKATSMKATSKKSKKLARKASATVTSKAKASPAKERQA